MTTVNIQGSLKNLFRREPIMIMTRYVVTSSNIKFVMMESSFTAKMWENSLEDYVPGI